MNLDKKIRIAYDEWNLRGWHHPNVDHGLTKEEYLLPRDGNDINSLYTMADAVFAACFLNMCLRNCDLVGMANYAPVVNTRGCIFTTPDGIVLRSTYHVFDLFVNVMGDIVVDSFAEDMPVLHARNRKSGETVDVDALDIVATRFSESEGLAVSAVNKEPVKEHSLILDDSLAGRSVTLYTVSGDSPDSYNDVDREEVTIREQNLGIYQAGSSITLPPHSVNVVRVQ